MNIDKELVGASTCILVLHTIAERPNYGYQIIKAVNALAGKIYTWQEGTIYPVLRRLEVEGLLKSEWRHSDAGRSRKYYFITGLGKEALRRSMDRWQHFYRILPAPQEN